MTGPFRLTLFLALAASITACDFDTQLAPRVELDVVVDGDGVRPHTTDLGYEIELTRCRVALDTIEFTTDGETHARAAFPVLDRLYNLAVPTAYAHPGHNAGGEVVGELPGQFVFDWRDDGKHLGVATMLAADYSGANFTLSRAEAGRGVAAGDPMIGHTFDIAGEATRDGTTVSFEILLDQDEGRRIVGLPLSLSVDEGTVATIGLTLHTVDPTGSDTVFDGVDFAALDDDDDGDVRLIDDTEAYNRVRRNLQVHEHYGTTVFEGG